MRRTQSGRELGAHVGSVELGVGSFGGARAAQRLVLDLDANPRRQQQPADLVRVEVGLSMPGGVAPWGEARARERPTRT